jgi:hypothetical protein
MTDVRLGVPVAARGGGPLGFLAETLASLVNRRLIAPAVILVLLLTASNIVLARTMPAAGGPLPPAFLVAGIVRLFGLIAIAVAILRVLGDSPRRPWLPDGGLWLFALTIFATIAIAVAARQVAGSETDPVRGFLGGVIVNLVTAPLAAWFAATAIERPLAWRAGPWLRGFGSWLLPLFLWSVLILVPLGQVHIALAMLLIDDSGLYFWPIAILDGPLSAVPALLGLALGATAYRHVARS